MKFIRRDPNRGYLDNWLWLPRSYVSEEQIRSSLVYEDRGGQPLRGWAEERFHLRVPRNYFSFGTLKKLPYPVVDARITKFPKASYRSTVTLDLLEPTKTYQTDGSNALVRTHDGILCLRCGAGKTVVSLHSAAQMNTPTLIIVDEKSLAEQWIESIVKFTTVKESEIGFIGDGRFDWQREITVGTVHTLANMAREGRFPLDLVHHFGLVIADEAHVMGAPHFNRAVPPFHGRRWGLSATPTREDNFDSLLRYTLGEVIYSYLEPDLIPTVYFRRTQTRMRLKDPDVWQQTHDVRREFHFGMTYGWMARENPDGRVDFIVNDVEKALAKGRNCLILTHSRDMCEILGDRLPGAGVVHGGVKGAERRRRIKECNPVIAIMKVGKQALDKPALDTLFVCEPFSKRGMLQQTMGRILRNLRVGTKMRPVVFIYEDHHITPIYKLCEKLRKTLRNWPSHMGGAIPYEKR